MAQQLKDNSLPVTLPSDMDPIPITGSIVATLPSDGAATLTVADIAVAIKNVLDILANPISQDANTGRVRVAVEAIGTTLALATVTNLVQIGGVQAQTVVLDTMYATWASAVRPRIT